MGYNQSSHIYVRAYTHKLRHNHENNNKDIKINGLKIGFQLLMLLVL